MDALHDQPVEALIAQGQSHMDCQQFEQAIQCFTQALTLGNQTGNSPVALIVQLANAHLALRQLPQAAPLLNAALQQAPHDADVITATGSLFLLDRQFDNACTWLQRAANLKPDDPSIQINLAQALTLRGDHRAAIPHLETAIQLDPVNHKAHFAAGRALMELGEMATATAHFERAIQLRPDYGLVYHLLATIRKFSTDDQPFIQQAETALQSIHTRQDQCLLHFALGKMYDDTGDYEQAFRHFTQGNALWEPEKKHTLNVQVVRNEHAVCTRKHLLKRHSGHPSDIPVFIVGMPRSGTTLLEQIIASHPAAAGAGEMPAIDRIANALFAHIPPPRFPWSSPPVPDRAILSRYADEYLGELRQGRESAARIVDKMPENYHWLGAIALLFPKARIIHTVRNPLDTCLSCYFQMFTEVSWAADLKQIATVYRNYRATMDHWRRTLPPGMLIDMHYEDVVSDTEQYSRQLVDACGLPWDPRCLDFASTRRTVMTSSVWQVRQPVYQSSKRRWTHYAPFISELANELADFLQEERELLQQHGITLRKTGARHPGN